MPVKPTTALVKAVRPACRASREAGAAGARW
jgi:hypothetical protein